jgi:hypothetical protein
VQPRELADELVRCRRRGLGRLDSTVGSEPQLELPNLERLCALHFGGRGGVPRDRGVAIGTLIRTVARTVTDERPADAQLVVELFFGDSAANVPVRGPGELLDAAGRRRPTTTEAVFRRQRRDTFLRFARAMVDFTGLGAPAPQPPAQAPQETVVRTDAAGVLALADDPAVPAERVLQRLREMAGEYEVDEVLDVIVRFDTPDILG